MDCPKCKVPLEVMELDGVKLDFCSTSCSGIWCDHNELAALIPGDEDFPFINEDVTNGTPTHMSCPSCGTANLIEMYYSDDNEILVDRCPNCKGVWLDFRELGQIRKKADQLLSSSQEFQNLIKNKIKKSSK